MMLAFPPSMLLRSSHRIVGTNMNINNKNKILIIMNIDRSYVSYAIEAMNI